MVCSIQEHKPFITVIKRRELEALNELLKYYDCNQKCLLRDNELKCIRTFYQLFSSVTQSCLTLCDPMDCNMPVFPVHHQLQELTQIYVHPVGDAIQPSHPLCIPFSSYLQSFSASGSFPMSWLLALGGQSIGVSASASDRPMNSQD